MLLPNFLSSTSPRIFAALSTITIVFLAAILGVLQHFPGSAPPPADPLTASFFSLGYGAPLPPLLPPLNVDGRALIFGGVPTPSHRYPYAVLLLKGKLCGGSLIADNLVLTAAHCGPDTFSELHVGIYSLGDFSTLYERVSIVEAIVHPDYAGVDHDYEHDFMILVLSRKVKKFRPVCLAEAGVNIIPEKKLAVMGWGLMEGGRTSELLMEAEVSYLSNAQCRSATLDGVYAFTNLVDSENYLCAASKDGKDACQGDSGGPLIMKGDDSDPDKDVQVGVVSFGYSCGTVGIYGRISTQRNWIDSVAREKKSVMRQDCNGRKKKRREAKGRRRTIDPTEELTNYPTLLPVVATTMAPTATLTSKPSPRPTARPSRPAVVLTKEPTNYPTSLPVVATTMATTPAPLHIPIPSDPSNGPAPEPTHSPTAVPTGVITIVPTHCQPVDVGILIEGDIVDCISLAEASQLNCTMARDAAACPIAARAPFPGMYEGNPVFRERELGAFRLTTQSIRMEGIVPGTARREYSERRLGTVKMLGYGRVVPRPVPVKISFRDESTRI
eukprot:CAMPEP_0194321788 /NCGR_PEP_ID=MMETSP0171-20130528/17974_1 /TAXON_ID=218684 /ORGANISM="Corethron pennatum, Strain L29A3" /LENGTH=555 /DNA_ID=CAMNT_0039079805 /DNA_START=140 /DNA_END=1808 /DNA_ORIENTATION=+